MSKQTTENELLSVQVPDKTETYTPVPHKILIQEVQDKIKQRGLNIISKEYMSGAFGQQMLGKYTIESGDSDLNMQLAFRNSYDKSMAVGFAAGATVFVCANGMLAGEMLVYRKHTGTVVEELHDYIIDGINMMDDNFNKLKSDSELMKQLPLNKTQQSEILGRLFVEEEIINSTQLNIVKRELDLSKHFVGKNAWCLYNNITEALKTSHVTNAMQDHLDLHKFFETEVIESEWA